MSAKKGHELLKKKCDALKTRFRVVMKLYVDAKIEMGDDFQKAFLSYANS